MKYATCETWAASKSRFSVSDGRKWPLRSLFWGILKSGPQDTIFSRPFEQYRTSVTDIFLSYSGDWWGFGPFRPFCCMCGGNRGEKDAAVVFGDCGPRSAVGRVLWSVLIDL